MNIFTGSPTIGSGGPKTSQQVALPSSGLTFRHLFLPRASKAVRQQVVAEELSYSLPFGLGDAHYGTVEKGDEAWVAIASDAVVSPIKDLYPRAVLEAEPLCYLRAAKAAGIGNALVIDFGASKTVFCGLENGRIGSVRVLLRGGDRLTQEVMESAGCTREQAEVQKRDEGTSHQVVRAFYLELIEEALLPTPLPYRTVLICGGGSATVGLLKLLNDRWDVDVDVEPFPLPGQLMPTDHVVAYGAALAGRPNAVKLLMDQSFRHAATRGGSPLHTAPLVLTALLMLLMVVSTETRLNSAQKKEQQLHDTLVTAIAPVIPKAAELEASAIVGELKSQLTKQKAVARRSPALLMNTLGRSAKAVTSKKDATIYSATFADDKLTLEGRAGSLKASEDIKIALETVMSDVEQVRTRPTSGSAFVFEIEGRPREF